MKKRKSLTPIILSALLGGMALSSCSFSIKDLFKKKGSETETQQKEEKATLTKISVSNQKTTYNVGESLVKPTVTATYSDGTTKDVTQSATFSVSQFLTAGQHTVIVAYGEKTTSFIVTVRGATLTSIEIGETTKKTFAYGESFQNPTILAVFDNGTSNDVTSNATIDSSKYNPNLSGQYEIKVTYENKTLTYVVTVNPPTNVLQKIELQGEVKTEYQLGDELVKPTVIATFLEGTKDVTNDCVFIYDFTKSGEQTVTVKYTQDILTQTITYNVNVIKVETKVKFAIFADVQLCAPEAGDGKAANLGETANSPLALEQHLTYIKNEGINVVLMNGDVTNQANENYYNYFESIATKVFGADKTAWPEFVWNMGNHEWWAGTTEDDPRNGEPTNYSLPQSAINSVKLFNEHARIESDNLADRSAIKYASNVTDTLPSYYKVINDVPFIVISGVNSSGLITDELKAEINSWLSEIKALESVKAGGPIFVEYHYPLATSMTHGQGSKDSNTSAIDSIFGEIPNAIIFTGDTHFPGNNERSINQDKYTTINLGTSSYSRMVDQSAVICNDYENVTGGHKEAGKGEIAQGNVGFKNAYTPNIQVVEVFDNNLTSINRFMTNEDGTARKVGESWSIKATTSIEDFAYTNKRFQNTDAALKLYGERGVSWNENDKVTFEVNKDSKQMTVHFNDPTQYHFVEHYDVKVNGVSHDFVSNYYKYLEEPEENYFVIENLPEAENYTVEVTAYDFFDNPSLNKLSATTETEGKAIDPIDLYFADGNFNYSDIETRNNFEYTSEGSNSSSEFYYRGIQEYKYGAILGRLVYNNLKVSDYLSLEAGEGSKPTVTFDVKNLKDDDLVFGLTVVTKKSSGGEDWKTDFGAEYQKTVSGKEWTTLSWNLNELFGISSKEELLNIGIKAKSKGASTNGYEMNFLIDNVNIVNNGDTPTPPTPTDRGEAFTSADGFVKDFESISTTDGKFVMDIKPTTGTDKKVTFGLFDEDWSNRVGWFDVQMDGSPVCDGVTVRSTNDGYLRVTVDFANLPANKFEPGHAAEVSHLQIHNTVEPGSWTTASGFVDVFPTEGQVIRGQRFQDRTDLTIDLSEQISLDETIKIDVKFDTPTSANQVAIMLGQGWHQYYGYFIIRGDGTLETNYDGVSAVNLDDGYIRATFDLLSLTKAQGGAAPTDYIDLIYVRGIWTYGSGYIDINSNEGNPIRGLRFESATDFAKDYKTEHFSLTDTFTFDVKFDDPSSENVVCFMLGQEWAKYYGYYKVKGDGTLNDTYNGVSIITLSDGYYRVTLDIAQLTKIDDTEPDEYINLFYIAGRYSTGGGYIDLNPGK